MPISLGGRQEDRRLVDQAPDLVLRMSENMDCFLPGSGAIFENFGIQCGSVFGHEMFFRADWALVLKRSDLCQESIHSRRVGSDGPNEVKSLEA